MFAMHNFPISICTRKGNTNHAVVHKANNGRDREGSYISTFGRCNEDFCLSWLCWWNRYCSPEGVLCSRRYSTALHLLF